MTLRKNSMHKRRIIIALSVVISRVSLPVIVTVWLPAPTNVAVVVRAFTLAKLTPLEPDQMQVNGPGPATGSLQVALTVALFVGKLMV